MGKETLIVEGIRRALEGLDDIMETLSDTGENTELSEKIKEAVEVATWIIDEA